MEKEQLVGILVKDLNLSSWQKRTIAKRFEREAKKTVNLYLLRQIRDWTGILEAAGIGVQTNPLERFNSDTMSHLAGQDQPTCSVSPAIGPRERCQRRPTYSSFTAASVAPKIALSRHEAASVQ